MSADPLTPDNVGEFNAFQYVSSNPLSYRDPTGNSVVSKIIKLILKGGDLAATFHDLGVALQTHSWSGPTSAAGTVSVGQVVVLPPA